MKVERNFYDLYQIHLEFAQQTKCKAVSTITSVLLMNINRKKTPEVYPKRYKI